MYAYTAQMCLFCRTIGDKHFMDCDLYRSITPDQCRRGEHAVFIRSVDPTRELKYEYECDNCTIPPIFSAVVVKEWSQRRLNG